MSWPGRQAGGGMEVCHTYGWQQVKSNFRTEELGGWTWLQQQGAAGNPAGLQERNTCGEALQSSTYI